MDLPLTGSATSSSPSNPLPRERLVGSAIAVLVGAAWFLSVADFDLWPLAWVAAVPMMFVLERASTAGRAFRLCWLAGFVGNVGGFYWFAGLLERFGRLPWWVGVILLVLLCSYQALIAGAWGWTVRFLRRRLDLPMALVAPVVMVTLELVTPFIFPWYLAISQAWFVPVIQVADLTGPLGVTALLVMTSGATYDLLTAPRRRRVAAAVAACLLVGALGYGLVRIGEADARRAAAVHAKIGLVQPNVRYDRKGVLNPDLAAAQTADLQDRSKELQDRGANLVVWPETSLPVRMPGGLEAEGAGSPIVRARARTVGDRTVAGEPAFDVPLVFGAITRPSDGPRGIPYNSAYLQHRDGRFVARYDKVALLPFSEYMPLSDTFPVLQKIRPRSAGTYAHGTAIVLFPFEHAGKTYRIAPMICLEDALPGLARRIAVERPHLLVNLTNDAWFGDTSEPWQHLALAVYRSVELRTEMVRAVNTGVTAHVDSAGRVLSTTYVVDPAKEPDHDPHGTTLLADVALLEGGRTVYAAVGDAFGFACLAATLALLAWAFRKGSRGG